MISRRRNILVIGASRGIGEAVAQHFSKSGDFVTSVSRRPATAGKWVQADISTADGIQLVAEAMGNVTLDALLFMGGVWENGAFTSQYDFMSSVDQETRFVVSINMIAPIELTRQLAKNLARSDNPRAIFIGSLSGLDNAATVEVANTASKFGLRGAAQALRLALRDYNIGITVINPGNVATAEVMTDVAEGRFDSQVPIPMEDLISAIEWVMTLSKHVDVGDISLRQKDQ